MPKQFSHPNEALLHGLWAQSAEGGIHPVCRKELVSPLQSGRDWLAFFRRIRKCRDLQITSVRFFLSIVFVRIVGETPKYSWRKLICIQSAL